MKRAMLLIALLALLLVAAAPLKYTFFGDYTIEATDKANFTQCTYWLPGEYTPYEEYVGYYSGRAQVEGPEAVLAFCLEQAP